MPIRRNRRPSEEGFTLIAVILLLAILTISMAVAAPRIAKEIQRDRELETMHRGKQYARAVRLYYKKFGAYPPNVDALVMTNQIRFLRKKYIDPTTGKDWKPVYVGQAKAPTAMGFFGQVLAGPGMAPAGLTNSPTGAGGNMGFGAGSNPGFGGSTNQPTGATGTTSGASDSASGTNSTDTNAANGNSQTGLSGQTFGGRVMGFSPNSPKQSILVYKKKNHYNEWEFVYDPITDAMILSGGNTGTIGQPAGTTNTPIGGPTTAPGPTPVAPPGVSPQ